MNEAGYPNGIDVTLWYTPIANGKEEADLAVVIQEQLAQIGVRVHLNAAEEGTFLSRFRKGEFEMALGIMSPDYPDPDSVAYFVGNSGGSYAKRVGLNDTLLDELTVQGSIATDPAERQRIYGEIQDRLADIMCYIPLTLITVYMFHRSNVLGVEPYYLGYCPWWLLSKTE
jgi:ABC-type transport system substrate-binding protein